MKKSTWETVRFCSLLLSLAGLAIGLFGKYIGVFWMSVVGIVMIFVAEFGYIALQFRRCPHCGKYLYRNYGDFCQNCGKQIYEQK